MARDTHKMITTAPKETQGSTNEYPEFLGIVCNPTNAKGKLTNQEKTEHSNLASITANYTPNEYNLQYYEHCNFK